ncbi:GRIP1-associated protein 1-like [Poecilia latipinna]|uniref:GRIP1-associated protein 1-like n=1 Tax=Poecilia formosa TaxID=48698 RepID=UPI000444464B|nr:PREDICTED: GRIP1-associated protein 1-like [Poecilia formosa]XP_014878341.1 PREDICTED: GRIP1-associated protein 1-like [Poecilia latipinna]
MDITEENISRMDMLEKIAELDYSQSQLRELNTEMRHWLEVADDDMAVLRSENASLRKQVKDLERIFSELQQVEVEPCGPLLPDALDENKICEKKFQDLEKETLKVQDENKELTAKIKNLKQEQEQDKIALNKLRTEFENLEILVEEVQIQLQRRDELIHQKSLQLKHLEETVEEYSEVIKDLRLTKQELIHQLEERRDEASFAAVTEVMGEGEGRPSPHLSIAEEIQQLLSAGMNFCTKDAMDPISAASDLDSNIKTGGKEQLEPSSLATDLQPKRGSNCAVILRATIRKLIMLCIVSVCVLLFIFCGCWVRNAGNFFSNSLIMLPPYVSVQYEALPPV